MLYSMTGYGQSIIDADGIVAIAEAKSVNSRYFETTIKLPTLLSDAEGDFVKLVRRYVNRGKIYLHIQILNKSKLPMWDISIDESMLDIYASLLESIDSRLIAENTVVSVDSFLSISDLFIRTPNPDVKERVFHLSLAAADEAMKLLRKSRRQEGRELQRDIQRRIATVKNLMRKIKKLHENSAPLRFTRLREFAEQLAADVEIDPIRLSQEIAYLAAKSDCTEEIVRLTTHIERIEKAIKSRKPVGSMLNFTLQECHREATTIGAKTDIAEISSLSIDLKEEFERMREQIQNIE